MAVKIVDLSSEFPGLTKGQLSGPPQGLVVHHTASSDSATPQSIAAGWAKSGTSAQYVMGRDGTIYQMVPDGGKAYQIVPSWNPSIPWATNSTTQGIELIAKDDGDVTPAQVQSLQQFALQQAQTYGYDPDTHVIGHGEVNGSAGVPKGENPNYLRQDSEGMTAVDSLRDYLKANPNIETAYQSGGPIPPMNIPKVGSAYADTSAPIPLPDPRLPPAPLPDPRNAPSDNPMPTITTPAAAASFYGGILPLAPADGLPGSPPSLANWFQNYNNGSALGNSAADSLAGAPASLLPYTPSLTSSGISPGAGMPSDMGMTTDLGNTYDSSSGGATLPAASSVDDGSGTGTPSPSVPLPRPRPDYTAPAAPAAPQTVTVNGNTYQVGSILQSAGRSYQVQADGTFKAMPHISIGSNTVASGIAAPMIQNAISAATTAAPAALASAGSAIGSLFGGLFGGSGASAAQPSSILPQTSGSNLLSEDQRNAVLATPSITPSTQTAAPSNWASAYLNSPAAQSTAPAGGGYNEIDAQAGPSNWAAPYLNTPNLPQASAAMNSMANSVGNMSALANQDYGSDLGSLDIPATVNVPKYINVQKQVTIPGQPIETGSGDTWVADPSNPDGGEYVLNSPQYSAPTTKAMTVQELNPKYVAPSPYTTPPLADSPINGLTASNPLSDWFGSTLLGHLTSALTGGTQSNTVQHGGLLSTLLSGGLPFGIGSNLSTPAQIQSMYAAMTPQQVANQNPSALSALAAGQSSYSVAGGNGSLLPTTTVSGGSRNTYADSSIGGDLSQSSF